MGLNINNRREFLKKAAIGSLLTVAVPQIISASAASGKSGKAKLGKGNVILFQGDSITDAGRKKEGNGFNNPEFLGSGYAMLAAAALLEKHASLDLKVYNKGISGNKVYQLADRWEADCLDIKPDILSILIGVNDFWHKITGNYKGTIEVYKNDYIALLERTRKALPATRLIICEPFAVSGVKAVDNKWFPDFYEYQKASLAIAKQFGAVYIPFQKVFDEAEKHAPGAYWTADGVHPSLAGAQLMASAWLEAVK
jgi:lysophospholipase L1-like esterase